MPYLISTKNILLTNYVLNSCQMYFLVKIIFSIFLKYKIKKIGSQIFLIWKKSRNLITFTDEMVSN